MVAGVYWPSRKAICKNWMSLSHTLNAIHISYSAFSIYLQLSEYVNLRNIEFFVEVDFEIKIFLLKKLNPMMMMRRSETFVVFARKSSTMEKAQQHKRWWYDRESTRGEGREEDGEKTRNITNTATEYYVAIVFWEEKNYSHVHWERNRRLIGGYASGI